MTLLHQHATPCTPCRVWWECGPERCSCGQRLLDCIRDHYRHECGHNFDGWQDITDDEGNVCGGTQVCTRCGLSAMSHDMMMGP